MLIYFLRVAEKWGNFLFGSKREILWGKKQKHPFKFDLKENKKNWFDFPWKTPPPQACNLDFFSPPALNRSDLHYTQSINNFSISTYFLGSLYESIHSSSKIQNNCVLCDSNRHCKRWWLTAIFPLPPGFFKEKLSMVLQTARLEISCWLRPLLTAVHSSDHHEREVGYLALDLLRFFFFIIFKILNSDALVITGWGAGVMLCSL